MIPETAIVAPLGFMMGMPFPAALQRLGGAPSPLAPWAIGVNGFASVVAAVGVIPVAMLWGFRVALLCGGASYVVAVLLGGLIAWRPAPQAPADPAVAEA